MKFAEYLTILAMVLSASSCMVDSIEDSITTKAQRESVSIANPGNLFQDDRGHWKAKDSRIPFIGYGKVIEDISGALISLASTSGDYENLIDTDLTNAVSFSNVAGVNITGEIPLVSVKDIYRKYAGGQTVGFVYRVKSDRTNLLSIDILKSFSIELCLDGVPVDRSEIQTGSGGMIGVDLITLPSSDGSEQRIVSYTCDSGISFDEIRLYNSGINVEVLSGLEIFYAFIGDNPIHYAVEGDPFFPVSPVINSRLSDDSILGVDETQDKENIVDPDTGNYAYFTRLLLGGEKHVTVNFNREIPAGYEVGYKFSNESLGGIDLLGMKAPKLIAYNADGDETESMDGSGKLLGISLISGEESFASMTISKPCSQIELLFNPNLLGEIAGKTYIYYAYVKAPTILDPSCFFAAGNEVTYTASYRLPTLAEDTGTLQYYIMSAQPGTSPEITYAGGSPVLTGLDRNGNYSIQAIYTHHSDGRQYSQIFTITRVSSDTGLNCNRYITQESHGACTTEAIGGWKPILSTSGSASALVDSDPDNYMEYSNPLSLIAPEPIVAVQLMTPVHSSASGIRTGFTVQGSAELLDADVLRMFEIRLYRDGVRIDEGVTTGNSAVDIGLIGTGTGKARLSILTDKEFDRIELWNTGVVSLLKRIKLFNVFYEDRSCRNSAPEELCMQIMSYSENRLKPDYEHMKVASGLSLNYELTGMSNAIDGDKETYAEFDKTLGLLELTGSRLAFSYGKLPANTAVGVILSLPESLLGTDASSINVGVLSGTRFSVCKDWNEIAGTTQGDLIAADLLSNEGLVYIEATPQSESDGLVLTFAGVADLLKDIRINGIYLRYDSDGDGIPDCAECGSGDIITNAFPGQEHYCGSNAVAIYFNGTASENEYILECIDYNAGRDLFFRSALETGNDGTYWLATGALQAGEYYISIWDTSGERLLYNGIHVYVHPSKTEWKGSPEDSSWDNWDNWSAGVPWTCTDVIIPGGASGYPVLAEGGIYNCRNIHFEPGAQVLGTHRLQYSYAFVDICVAGGRYSLMTAPLKGTVSGDFFINPDIPWGKDMYFTVPSPESYPETRISPAVYQRNWSRAAEEYSISGSGSLTHQTVTPVESGWTDACNDVSREYFPGEGFSIKPGRDGDMNSYVFRLPKDFNTYHFYSADGKMLGSLDIDRNVQYAGQLADKDGMPVRITLCSDTPGRIFLAGNPYMACLDVGKFLSGNPELTGIKRYDGNNNNPLVLFDGQLTGYTSGYGDGDVIAPGEGFFIETGTASTSASISITEDMLMIHTGSVRRAAAGTAPVRTDRRFLSIRAEHFSGVSTCGVIMDSGEEDSPDDDSELLAEKGAFTVFTVAGDKACDLQETDGSHSIPLGFIVPQSGRVTLSFNTGGDWEGWVLTDTEGGKDYRLDSKTALYMQGNNAGRYILRKIKGQGNEQ